MTFDRELELRKIDRFVTYYDLKYSDYNQGIDDLIESEDYIWNLYKRFISAYITKTNKLGQCKQAFWANQQFCTTFHEYFWMDQDMFSGDNHYFPWRTYCEVVLNVGVNHDKPEWSDYFLLLMRKYRTWPEPRPTHSSITDILNTI